MSLLLALLGCVQPPDPGAAPLGFLATDDALRPVGGLVVEGRRERLDVTLPGGPRLLVEQDGDVATRFVDDAWARGTVTASGVTLQRGLSITPVALEVEDAARSAAGGLVMPSAWRRAARDLTPQTPATLPVLDPVAGRVAAWTVTVREAVDVDGAPAWRVYAASAGSGHTAFLRPDGALLGVDGVAGGARLAAMGATLPWPRAPARPVGVREAAVSVTVEDAVLSGTLATLGGGPRPLVMLHAGSGPIDRDGLGPGFPWGGYRDLAWLLALDGYAVLRVDKRGVGESRGRSPGRELTHTADALLGDATAWLDEAATWDGVDRDCAVFVGHSEGGSLAPFVAQRRRLAGVVTLAGPHDDLHAVLREQLEPVLRAAAAREDEIAAARRAQAASLLALTHGGDDLPGPLRGDGAAWLRSHRGLEPGPALADLDLPVLALFGAHDVQVLPTQRDKLAGALADKTDAQVVLVEGVDHLLGVSPVPGMGHYADPDRGLSPGITDPLRAFLQQVCPTEP